VHRYHYGGDAHSRISSEKQHKAVSVARRIRARVNRKTPMKSPRTAVAEAALASLLDALAAPLLSLDITPARLAQIARASFVKAGVAGTKSRKSGRPHIARIAAITGLSRLEVKKIVSAQFTVAEIEPEQTPRAVRVLHAWQTSKTYSKKRRPKSLRLTGSSPSFESLCKQFSGDIPHRVILDELQRRNAVLLGKGKNQVSVLRRPQGKLDSSTELSSVEFAATFIQSLVQDDEILVKRNERISVSNEMPVAYVQQAVSERLTSLLDSFSTLFARKRGRGKSREAVQVYTLVVRPRKKR
jgi:hypothetical protein